MAAPSPLTLIPTNVERDLRVFRINSAHILSTQYSYHKVPQSEVAKLYKKIFPNDSMSERNIEDLVRDELILAQQYEDRVTVRGRTDNFTMFPISKNSKAMNVDNIPMEYKQEKMMKIMPAIKKLQNLEHYYDKMEKLAVTTQDLNEAYFQTIDAIINPPTASPQSGPRHFTTPKTARPWTCCSSTLRVILNDLSDAKVLIASSDRKVMGLNTEFDRFKLPTYLDSQNDDYPEVQCRFCLFRR